MCREVWHAQVNRFDRNMTNRISLQHNESYWLLDDVLMKAYTADATAVFSRYPDYAELTELLAEYVGVIRENILVTSGSDAAVRLIAELEHESGNKVLLPVPSFYGYEKIFSQIGLDFDTVSFTEEMGVFTFPLDAARTLIQSGAYSALFICQPNNPLGSALSEETINTLITLCGNCGVRLIIDEAYFEFLGRTSVSEISQQNIVILRTLSKSLGLAGARVGYVCANSAYLKLLSARMLPWSVAHPSVYAAVAGLRQIAHVRTRMEAVIHERAVFLGALRQVPGVHAYPSETNFILSRVDNAQNVAAALKEKGIDVALCSWMSNDTDARALLSDTIRMAVPSPSDRDRVIATLEEAVAGTRQM